MVPLSPEGGEGPPFSFFLSILSFYIIFYYISYIILFLLREKEYTRIYNLYYFIQNEEGGWDSYAAYAIA
jgi:hypothetical protein